MDYREILRTEFQKRRETNPFYSLRTFAKDLNLTVQHLSLIFKGKAGLSKERADFVAQEMKLKSFEARAFVFLVKSQSGRSLTTRNIAKMALRKPHFEKAKEELKHRSENNLPPLPPIIKKQHVGLF